MGSDEEFSDSNVDYTPVRFLSFRDEKRDVDKSVNNLSARSEEGQV